MCLRILRSSQIFVYDRLGMCLVLACASVCIGYCEFLRQFELGVGDIYSSS